MPNHITNRIQFSGKREDIDRVLALIKGDNECIDFEKIIPMPNNIYRGDLDQRARALYGKTTGTTGEEPTGERNGTPTGHP